VGKPHRLGWSLEVGCTHTAWADSGSSPPPGDRDARGANARWVKPSSTRLVHGWRQLLEGLLAAAGPRGMKPFRPIGLPVVIFTDFLVAMPVADCEAPPPHHGPSRHPLLEPPFPTSPTKRYRRLQAAFNAIVDRGEQEAHDNYISLCTLISRFQAEELGEARPHGAQGTRRDLACAKNLPASSPTCLSLLSFFTAAWQLPDCPCRRQGGHCLLDPSAV